MSVVDLPPSLDIPTLSRGEFASRPGARRLARRVVWLVVAEAVVTVLLAGRRLHSATAELALAIALLTVAIALLGLAVRRARLRIDLDGARWGWRTIGFRMARGRIREARVYRDAVAFQPTSGSPWYLSASDWAGFEEIPRALAEAEIPHALEDRPAPVRARLQSYGTVLSGLLVLDVFLGGVGMLVGLAV